jgi:hypothetical protein
VELYERLMQLPALLGKDYLICHFVLADYLKSFDLFALQTNSVYFASIIVLLYCCINVHFDTMLCTLYVLYNFMFIAPCFVIQLYIVPHIV